MRKPHFYAPQVSSAACTPRPSAFTHLLNGVSQQDLVSEGAVGDALFVNFSRPWATGEWE